MKTLSFALRALRGALPVAAGCLASLSTLFAAEPPTDVLIAFTAQPGPAEIALVRSHGGSVKRTFTLVPAVSASVPAAAINGLSNHPRVTAVEIDGLFHAITLSEAEVQAELDSTWGVKRIGAGTVHAEPEGSGLGNGVLVAVIDSGIDYTHPDLAENFSGGYDFVNSDADPMDDNGHGTHVAGTVAAVLDGKGVVGAAPEARLYGLKVLNASGSGSFSNIIAALEWCVENGIAVTNNSYGAGSDPGTIVRQAFDNSAAAGVLHIAAAGNSGNTPGTGNNVGYPARYDSVIAVAATTKTDARASFSSTGPTVELAAPGVAINSTLRGGGYGSYNGTSMASPHVAGVAALLSAFGASGADIRTILQQTATDLGAAGRDNHYGFGLVNAEEAILALDDQTSSVTEPSSDPSPLSIGSVSSAKINPRNGRFEITWTTNVPASSEIQFTSGTTGTFTDSAYKTEHRMEFKGSNGVTYTFMVRGVSAEGSPAESGPHTHPN